MSPRGQDAVRPLDPPVGLPGTAGKLDAEAAPAGCPPAQPVRVRVVAPRRQANSSAAGTSVLQEVAEQSPVGEVFVRSLIRSQLRLAAVVAVGFGLVLLACWLLVQLAPALVELRVVGIPLPWLVLGAGIYPVIGLCAWLYVRAASRNEARYRDLVGDK
ncbi:hypothetical protein ACQCSX_19870 [Pseudarthrobacter sp. P1]|uniref:hypothetical protein n=1 Tax=Pseudarthrobacter sp. P1 TaxID=3418418 RepID=UPI003CF457A9